MYINNNFLRISLKFEKSSYKYKYTSRNRRFVCCTVRWLYAHFKKSILPIIINFSFAIQNSIERWKYVLYICTQRLWQEHTLKIWILLTSHTIILFNFVVCPLLRRQMHSVDFEYFSRFSVWKMKSQYGRDMYKRVKLHTNRSTIE